MLIQLALLFWVLGGVATFSLYTREIGVLFVIVLPIYFVVLIGLFGAWDPDHFIDPS